MLKCNKLDKRIFKYFKFKNRGQSYKKNYIRFQFTGCTLHQFKLWQATSVLDGLFNRIDS